MVWCEVNMVAYGCQLLTLIVSVGVGVNVFCVQTQGSWIEASFFTPYLQKMEQPSCAEVQLHLIDEQG